MNFDFDEYMNTRVPLRFRPDGTFRILILTDPHGGSDSHPQLKPGIDAIVEAARPDLLIFGGDMTGHKIGCATLEELRGYVSQITETAERLGVPWAHVYGNHDYNKGLSNEAQQAVYESFPHCVSRSGPEDIHGTGNSFCPS